MRTRRCEYCFQHSTVWHGQQGRRCTTKVLQRPSRQRCLAAPPSMPPQKTKNTSTGPTAAPDDDHHQLSRLVTHQHLLLHFLQRLAHGPHPRRHHGSGAGHALVAGRHGRQVDGVTPRPAGGVDAIGVVGGIVGLVGAIRGTPAQWQQWASGTLTAGAIRRYEEQLLVSSGNCIGWVGPDPSYHRGPLKAGPGPVRTLLDPCVAPMHPCAACPQQGGLTLRWRSPPPPPPAGGHCPIGRPPRGGGRGPRPGGRWSCHCRTLGLQRWTPPQGRHREAGQGRSTSALGAGSLQPEMPSCGHLVISGSGCESSYKAQAGMR